jgi:hypothetical protein
MPWSLGSCCGICLNLYGEMGNLWGIFCRILVGESMWENMGFWFGIYGPDAPCMVYLPTFAPKIVQM